NVSNISGVPSWTLVLLKRILELNKTDNILDIWPNLELFMHGGVNFSPYKEQFKKLAPGKQLNYYENYNATEGFFGLQDQSQVEEMLLMLDYGIFYEFIEKSEIEEESPNTITLDNVDLYKNYAVVISTNAGLWRYIIGDTIQFTSLNPFRFKVTGRIGQFINAFGEELIIENAERAFSKACVETESVIKEYTGAPQFFESKPAGNHQWLIEFEKEPENIKYFSEILDSELKRLNSDYEAKRFNSMVLDKPEIHLLKSGTFYNWMKINNKLGGQHKIPRLSNNRKYVQELLKMV
ncbi:MAG: GH3 auxin-responsive promoter family protein, partial [Vicingaceae bacterium]